jgi:hypothetical protein
MKTTVLLGSTYIPAATPLGNIVTILNGLKAAEWTPGNGNQKSELIGEFNGCAKQIVQNMQLEQKGELKFIDMERRADLKTLIGEAGGKIYFRTVVPYVDLVNKTKNPLFNDLQVLLTVRNGRTDDADAGLGRGASRIG